MDLKSINKNIPCLPSQVVLEVTNACNLKCKGCAVHGPHRFVTRPVLMMKEKLWRTVIEEAGSWNHDINLTLHGGGEPLLHPHLRDIIAYAKTFPRLNTGFLTNGMLMDRTWSEFVLEKNMDWIAFSIDGVLPETHKIVRQKSDLYRIEKNLATLLELRQKNGSGKPAVSLNMVTYEEVADQQEAFLAKWLHLVDSISISHYRNPPSSRRWPRVPLERTPCFLLWNQMIIASDGRLGLCCEDFNIDYCIGKVGEKTLAELWNGPEMTKMRKLQEQGDWDKHPMCRICDTWADNYPQKEDTNPGYSIIRRASQTEYRAK
ncbi:MAG: radical SAM protein [Desulfococcaceae bacterium]|nr:radical SAM protein [Desulfococcaceae bacterium]